MEENNKKQGTDIDIEAEAYMEQMKKEITKEVEEMLKQKGIKVIEKDYSAEKEMVAIVEDYQNKIKEIDKQIEYNNRRYKDDVAKIKNVELNLDKKDELYEANKKLDNIIKNKEKLDKEKIERFQNDKNYKEAKMETLQILNMLKDVKDIPTETLIDLLEPLVNAQDVKALSIVEVMLQSNLLASHTLTRVIDEINMSLENRELKEAVDVFKKYLVNNEENLTVFAYMKKFKK